MPQLDILTFSSQIFWFCVFFCLLFLVVNYIFLPKLEMRIYRRSTKVLHAFSNSICLLELAENQVKEYNQVLSQAETRVREVMSDTLMQIEKIRAGMKSQLEEENKKIAKFVKGEIENFKIEYIDRLKQMAASIALIYYAKLTNSEMDKEKFLLSKKF